MDRTGQQQTLMDGGNVGLAVSTDEQPSLRSSAETEELIALLRNRAQCGDLLCGRAADELERLQPFPSVLTRPKQPEPIGREHWWTPLYIGGRDDPYMIRYFLIPRNAYFNVYVHHILRSDEDRALHDHPWSSFSVLLWGPLGERYAAADGVEAYRLLRTGAALWRPASFTHRLILPDGTKGAWTLFITGRKSRAWGFHCPGGRWVHWRDFTSGENGETVGRGCD